MLISSVIHVQHGSDISSFLTLTFLSLHTAFCIVPFSFVFFFCYALPAISVNFHIGKCYWFLVGIQTNKIQNIENVMLSTNNGS